MGNALRAASLASRPPLAALDKDAASHIYVLEGVEVEAAQPTRVIVAFGDSITDGAYATAPDKTWPGVLATLANRTTSPGAGVINTGIGGNELTSDQTWLPFGPAGFSSRTRKSGGQVSRVRTAFVEMTLDHDSGAMRGQVLAGQFAGRALDDLDIDALIALLREADDETRSLLVPYLDRRDAGWREHAQGDAAAGRAAPGSAKMTEEEAYQILGLQRGASERDITRAHRALMKKFHPDQGGSTYLAARINEAKEKLLRQHR